MLHAGKALTQVFGNRIEFLLGMPSLAAEPDAIECFHRKYPTGAGEIGHQIGSFRYLPLSNKEQGYGIVRISCRRGEVHPTSSAFLESVVNQTVMTIERNRRQESEDQPG